MLSSPVFGLAAILALAFLVFYAAKGISWPKTIAKTLSVLLLAYVAQNHTFLMLGLIACAVGDFLLSRDGDAAFLSGMVSFAIGHLLYLALFVSLGADLSLMTFILFLSIGCVVAVLLWPQTGVLCWPVMGYIVIISTMCIYALGLPKAYLVASIGALVFALSDITLAFEKFLLKPQSSLLKFTPYAVWSTYWIAQALIVIGLTSAM